MTGKYLTITMSSPQHRADDIAHYAYSAAIYIYNKGDDEWENDTYPEANAEPTEVIHVATWDDGDEMTLSTPVNIPSIVGQVSTANAVGLKVVIRVFVDGDLVYDDHTVQLKKEGYVTPTGTQASLKKDAGVVYYAKTGDGESAVYTVVNTMDMAENADMTGYFVIGEVNDGDPQAEYCVNSNKVPIAAASLEFNFAIGTEAPAAPADPEVDPAGQ